MAGGELMEIWFYDEVYNACFLSSYTEESIGDSGALEDFIYFFVEVQ